MSRIPLKSVLRELERRGEVRFGDNEYKALWKQYEKITNQMANSVDQLDVLIRKFKDLAQKENDKELVNLFNEAVNYNRAELRSAIWDSFVKIDYATIYANSNKRKAKLQKQFK